MNKIAIGSVSALLLVSFSFSGASVAQEERYIFTGGKPGGTSIYYANAISQLAKNKNMNFMVNSSGGAVEQIRLVDAGKSDFSLAYSGQAYHAARGELKNDPTKYENIRAMGFFYGAPAQLIINKNSNIESTYDLAGKKVAVGNAGSGAAEMSKLFFTELGIWDDIDARFIGYRQSAEAFNNGQVDAFWVFVGYPNASVTEAAFRSDVDLVNIYEDGESIDLYKKYPYLEKETIPGDTYQGVDNDVETFQDKTLWIVNNEVPNEVVYEILDATFSKEGLEHMVNPPNSPG